MKKRLILITLAVALPFAVLWTYVRSDAFAARIRPFLVKPLEEALGEGSRIGRIKASLLPLSLEVRDIAVPAPRAADALAVRKITLTLNPFALIVKKLSFPSITVLEPRIDAERSAEGEVDVERVVRSIAERALRPGTGAGPFREIVVGTITVRNGRLRIRDAGSQVRVACSRLYLTTTFLRSGAVAFRLTEAVVQADIPSYPALSGGVEGAAVLKNGRITIERLAVESPAVRAALSGTAGLGPQAALDLALTVRGGAKRGAVSRLWQKEARRHTGYFTADITATGTIADPVIDGTATAGDVRAGSWAFQSGKLAAAYRQGTITLSGADWALARDRRQFVIREAFLSGGLREGGIDVASALLRTDDAELIVGGRIDPATGYSLAFDLEMSGPGTTLESLTRLSVAGNLSLRGSLSGPLRQPEAQGAVIAGPLTVRGVKFQSLSGALSFRGRTLAAERVAISQGASRYVLDGSVSFREAAPRYQARLTVVRSDVVSMVALFYRPIPIDLRASGTLSFQGTAAAYAGSGSLQLEAGIAYGEPFDRGSLAVELATGRVSFPRIILDKREGEVRASGWIGFDGTYAARLESSGVDLSEISRLAPLQLSGPLTLDISSSGSFSAPIVKARAESPALAYREARLGGARCDLEIVDGALTASAAVADDERESLRLRGTLQLRSPYAWNAAGDLDVDEAGTADLFRGTDLLERMRLTVRGAFTLQGAGGRPASINGSLRLGRIAMGLDEYRIANEGDGIVDIRSGVFDIRTLTLSGSGTRLALSGSVRPAVDVDLAVSGTAGLSLLRVLTRAVEHGDGTAEISLRISDRWSSPEVSGRLTVRDGQITIKDVPQKFTSLNGTVLFDRGRIVSEGVAGEVGGGVITASGSAQLDGMALQDFSAKAVIDKVTVRYPPGLTAIVAGTLYYDGDRSAQSLSGEIGIQRARYEKRVDWKSMLLDFRKGFTQKKKTEIGWIGETQINLRFYGKESILFESNLASIPLEVDMIFQGTVNQPKVLGRIEARKGEVYFRRNIFRILYASVDFADPNRINPLLDVQAETRVREYQVRLAVSGTADRAVVSFLSDPPLTDTNILALLTLGRTTSELKGKEADVGSSEAVAFATGKFQDILETRARSLTGLDRFQVDPYINKTDVSVPRVTVGKEVVPEKVFLTYSSNVGGDAPEQLFRIEYLLNRNVSVVGEQDELGKIGADLKFRFEFR